MRPNMPRWPFSGVRGALHGHFAMVSRTWLVGCEYGTPKNLVCGWILV